MGCGAQAAEPPRFLTGADFTQQLNRPLLAGRDDAPLREMLERLSSERKIAILLDRRIDPDQRLNVHIQADFFDEGINDLVKPLTAEATVLGDAVFVARPQVARTLRTRVELAERRLDALLQKNFSRKIALARRAPVRWGFLTSPQEILQEIAARYELTFVNLPEIPHDLWAAGEIAHPSATEALLLIATQFGKDIRWIDDRQVEFVPETAHPQIERVHPLRGIKPDDARNRVLAAFPDLAVRTTDRQLTAVGLIEQQEAIDVLLGNRPARKPQAPAEAGNLSNRRFTLRMVQRPLADLLQQLEKQDIIIRKDDAALDAAGISLKVLISLELQNATIETLLDQACIPLGLNYRIQGLTIELFPADAKR
jgi:hypothetical protein